MVGRYALSRGNRTGLRERERRTAGPSTALRFGRDDKAVGRPRSTGIGVLIFFLYCVLPAGAQNGKQQRVADLAYKTEMDRDVNACPEAQTVTDRDVCLNDARVETYKNYSTFFDALREALIQSSPNDDNALALDRTEVVWEKYRVIACDVLARTYDAGTVKHPGPVGPSSQTRCLITLTRSRMKDLKQLYESTL